LLFTEEERKESLGSIINFPERVQGIIWDHIIDSITTNVNLLEGCKSPIEQILIIPLHNIMAFLAHRRSIQAIKIDNQQPIEIGGKVLFYVDFMVSVLQPDDKVVSFVIECDGHEFHEKTKIQAAKDRSRERKLQSEGFTVIRFTGSEIYEDPYQCAREVREIIVAKIEQHE